MTPPRPPQEPPTAPAGVGTSTPRLPVGAQTQAGLQAVLRRVASPDLPLARKVWSVAWPVVLSNMLQSLALTVDLIFVGALGPLALAATGVATQVFFVGMTVGTGLATAATALVARGIGAGDERAADGATTVALLLALAASVPLMAATWFLDTPLLRLLGADEATVEQGALVLRVLAFAIPGNMLVLVAGGALQGAGDTRPALLVGIGVNVLNLVLDWMLIFGNLGAPAMGLRGAALATTLAFSAGGLAFLVLLRRGRRPTGLTAHDVPVARTAARLARVGGPAALESFLLSLGFTVYLVLILRFGAEALAAHQIGLRVQSFAFMPGFGFAAAAAALVGQGLGRGDPRIAERNGWAAIGLGAVAMVGLSVPLFLLAEPLAGLFTDSPEALALGTTWIHVLVLAMPAIALHFGAAGALKGAGDTRWPLAVSFVGLWLVRLPLAWWLGVQMGWGMAGVWAGYVLEYYGRAVVTTWRYARGRWKTTTV